MTQAELFQAIAGGAILVPFIGWIMAGIKTALPDSFPSKYWPGVSVAVGIALSLAFGALTGGDWRLDAIVGMFAGLSASGLYAVGVASQQPPAPRG
jgi:hypothetical protein